MANELDEMTGPVNGAGRDINVIEKQLPARVGWGSTLFEIVLVALSFPMAAESVPPWAIFGFFGVMMVFHFLWVLFVVPETKGRRLEDIQL